MHTNQTLAEQRKMRIVAVKAAARQLALDDDVYRSLLHKLTGKRSAADLSLQELGKVLDHMRAQGAVNPNHGRRRPVPSQERAALLAKINALLTELGRVTGRPKTLRYADAIAKRRGWAENVDFCDTVRLRDVVAALTATLRAESERGAGR